MTFFLVIKKSKTVVVTLIYTSQTSKHTSVDSLTIYTENVDLIYGVSHIRVKPSSYLCVDSGLQDEGTSVPS